MTDTNCELIAKLAEVLARQKYSPVVVGNYCCYARAFLGYLARRDMPVTTVTSLQVEQYLRYAVRSFRKRHGRAPGPHWHSIPRSGIHALLRLAQGHWPPAPEVIGPDATLRHTICHVYETWLRDERGLATASIDALMWEARHFLAWELDHGGSTSLIELSVRDIDLYMDTRTLGLRRKSLKDVAERRRSLLRYMYRTRHVPTDLAPHVLRPYFMPTKACPRHWSAARSSRCWRPRKTISRQWAGVITRCCSFSRPMGCGLAKSETCCLMTSTGARNLCGSATPKPEPVHTCP